MITLHQCRALNPGHRFRAQNVGQTGEGGFAGEAANHHHIGWINQNWSKCFITFLHCHLHSGIICWSV